MSHENSRRNFSLFQMWEPFRDSLIEEQHFYLKQGKTKLLSQFNDMEREADEAAVCWLESRAPYFDPGRDDPSAAYESAYDEGIKFYQLLSDMRDQIRLSLVAGMFHVWDKQLRNWLVKEIRHWYAGEAALKKVWSANFDEIASLLDATGLASKNATYMQRLSTYRYVINVYKHGNGAAFDTLKAIHPEFLRRSLSDDIAPSLNWVDFTSLAVSDQHLDELSQAICDFWQSLPLNVYEETVDELPGWFQKVLVKS